jgi:hypothetical protein
MYLVTMPDHHAYFESHGLPDIEWRMKITTIVLYTRVAVMLVTSALQIIWMWWFEIVVVINGVNAVLSGRLYDISIIQFFLTFLILGRILFAVVLFSLSLLVFQCCLRLHIKQ